MKKSSTNGNELFSKFFEFLGQNITQCVKLETLLASPQQKQQGMDKQVSNRVFAFNILIYIKFKSIFNMSNPKESNRKL